MYSFTTDPMGKQFGCVLKRESNNANRAEESQNVSTSVDEGTNEREPQNCLTTVRFDTCFTQQKNCISSDAVAEPP